MSQIVKQKQLKLLSITESDYNIKPKTKDELVQIIKDYCKENGWNSDLNFIDTSLITDMSYLFSNSEKGYGLEKFNGDISKWNVSNVKEMTGMFCTNSFYEGVSTELHVNNVDFDSETVCRHHFLSPLSNGKTHEILNSLIRSNSEEKVYSDFLKLYTKIRKSKWFISSTLNKSLGVQYQSE